MDYSNLTITELISKISASRFFNLPKMVAEALRKLNLNVYQPSYKVYSALLTQTGTSAPTAVVLENTTGEVFTWFYDDIGNYHVAKSTDFDTEKIGLLTQTSGYSDGSQKINIDFFGGSEVAIESYVLEEGVYAKSNDLLGNHFIEIRIYN